jgi:hypothetical protein
MRLYDGLFLIMGMEIEEGQMKNVNMLFLMAAVSVAACDRMPRSVKANASPEKQRVLRTGPPQYAMTGEGAERTELVNSGSVCGVKMTWNYTRGYVKFANGGKEGKVAVEYKSPRENGGCDLALPAGASSRMFLPFKAGDKVTVAVDGPGLDRSRCVGAFLLAR